MILAKSKNVYLFIRGFIPIIFRYKTIIKQHIILIYKYISIIYPEHIAFSKKLNIF